MSIAGQISTSLFTPARIPGRNGKTDNMPHNVATCKGGFLGFRGENKTAPCFKLRVHFAKSSMFSRKVNVQRNAGVNCNWYKTPEIALDRIWRSPYPLAMLYRTIFIAIMLLSVGVFARPLDGEEAIVAAPGQEMLILRNGQTFEGRITQKDDLYLIDLGDGQVRVKVADVDVICNSLEDGYKRKRVLIEVGDVHAHLELAQWCMRHKLFGPAAAELADATDADPNHPMIGVLRHRLEIAMEPPLLPTQAVEKSTAPSGEELDRMARNLPRGTVETFTQLVQPVLLNHCATSGCHGPQSSSELRLFRVPASQLASRRITQRNLYSVLTFVDHENPNASRLLTAATEPHGSLKLPIFNEHQATQYKRIESWVHQLAGQSGSESETPLTVNPLLSPRSTSTSAQPTPPKTLSPEVSKAQPLSASEKNLSVSARHNVSRTHPAANDKAAQSAPLSESADPQDPEAFNRHFATSQKKSE
jgi:hypothetical protein